MSEKKKVIIPIVAVCLVIIIALVFFLKPNGYRSIRILEISGIVTYDRGNDKDVEVYDSMSLTSGDTMRTGNDSFARMNLDDTKFVYMEQESEVNFVLSRGLTNLDLTKGAIVNEIEQKLTKDESYEVKTPNALMSVRGTRFRVSVYVDANGIYYSRFSVMEGVVESNLVYPDGSVAEEPVSVAAGDEALVYYDAANNTTDYVRFDSDGNPTLEGGETSRAIRYDEMPEQVLEYIKDRVEENPDYADVTEADIDVAISNNNSQGEPTISKDTEEGLVANIAGNAEVETNEAASPTANTNTANNRNNTGNTGNPSGTNTGTGDGAGGTGGNGGGSNPDGGDTKPDDTNKPDGDDTKPDDSDKPGGEDSKPDDSDKPDGGDAKPDDEDSGNTNNTQTQDDFYNELSRIIDTPNTPITVESRANVKIDLSSSKENERVLDDSGAPKKIYNPITVSGTLTLKGDVDNILPMMSNITVASGGSLNIEDNVRIDGPLTVSTGGSVNINGNATVGNIYLYNGAVIINSYANLGEIEIKESGGYIDIGNNAINPDFGCTIKGLKIDDTQQTRAIVGLKYLGRDCIQRDLRVYYLEEGQDFPTDLMLDGEYLSVDIREAS